MEDGNFVNKMAYLTAAAYPALEILSSYLIRYDEKNRTSVYE